MADTYPTPTRVALLRDVQAGAIRDDQQGVPRLYYADGDRTGSVRVAASVRDLAAVGWIEPGPGDGWELTDTGRTVIEEAGDG